MIPKTVMDGTQKTYNKHLQNWEDSKMAARGRKQKASFL
jgi:hypothetical protein